jgi:ADP-dependent NAD(P)H-hydrate dehydratase / NAD(P)H-hydrate epimerase
MEPLLTSAEMQRADRFTIDEKSIPETVLMEHAALAVVKALESRFGSTLLSTRGLIVAGPGNNGGDALAAARLLHHRGHSGLSVVALGKKESRSASCQLQANILYSLGLEIESQVGNKIEGYDWIIVGIFGTGLARPVEGEYREVIERINAVTSSWILAIDMPSGLCANTGMPLGIAVRASHTVTLGFYKRGLVTGEAAEYTGQLSLATIQIPRSIPGVTPEAFLFDDKDAKTSLPKRLPSGHKGTYGHVYIWAGRPETEGACAITSLAAWRAGSGLVSLFGESETLNQIRPRLLPEVMSTIWGKDFFQKENSVFAIGPGMGTNANAWSVLKEALLSAKSLVVDADGLNLMAQNEAEALVLCKKRSNPILMTPHPKEASRLLQTSVDDIQRDRYSSARRLAEKWNAWALLKGRGTIVVGPSSPMWVVNRGNSVLSKGGTGDLLTGIIASLLGQGLSPQVALALAAYLHGRSAEIMAQKRGEERSALASEVADGLSLVYSSLDTLA